MTRVYVDMVADLFHAGHVALLRRARGMGDELVVGVHSDRTVRSYKRQPVMTMEERIAVVAACRYVDRVIPDAPLVVTPGWLARHGIDLVVHGDDFDEATLQRCYGAARAAGILRLVPYTAGISTSDLIARVARMAATTEMAEEAGTA